VTGGQSEAPRPPVPAYRTISARAPVAYWEMGDGPPLVLLHTFPDHAVGMLPFARELAGAGYRVVVPALPGYWPSGRVPDGDYAIPSVARDIVALIDALGLERPDVLGHGWGGEIAYHLGSHSHERIGRIVVISVPHVAGLARRHRTFQGLQSAGYAYFLAYSPLAAEVASQPEWLTAVVGWASPGMHRGDWTTILQLIARRSEVETAGSYYRCDLEAHSSAEPVLAPAAVIHGADTQALPPDLFEGLDEWFPAGLTRHLIESAGQWPHLEAPAETLALALAHLDA
jgi:pimeloyl-ACP methyl ester carboxylesterase